MSYMKNEYLLSEELLQEARNGEHGQWLDEPVKNLSWLEEELSGVNDKARKESRVCQEFVA